jgi:hypothetical protein
MEGDHYFFMKQADAVAAEIAGALPAGS